MAHVRNFTAGPAALPAQVVSEAAAALTDFAGSGISLLSISHRDKRFEQVVNNANRLVKKLLRVPDNYSVLWMQGGASTQFAAVVLNLLARRAAILPNAQDFACEYVVSGTWSEKAAEEASNLGAPVHVLTNGKSTNYTSIAPTSQWRGSDRPVLFRYYCANETVHGVEFDMALAAEDNAPLLVADMSSNIMSKPVDVARHAIIYAGVQKNLGPAGVTLVIARNDLLTACPAPTRHMLPTMLDYHTFAAANSLYNTPPVFAIYATERMLHWLATAKGGLDAMARENDAKARALYAFIDQSRLFRAQVDPSVRSRMNVVFRIVQPAQGNNDDDDDKARRQPWKEGEAEFLAHAERDGMVGLAGHRSVGGLRASLYNAVTMDDVQALIQCMRDWEQGKKAGVKV
ncbi:Phosphoserine aminotransferase [Sorochytrium milnesiophthora]